MSAMSSPYGSAVIDPTALDYEPYCLAAMSWAQAVDTVWGAILIPNDVNLQNLRLVSHAYHTTHPIAPHDLAPYSDPTNWAQSAAATVAIALEGDANYAAAGLIPPPLGGSSGIARARGVFLGVLPANLTQFIVAASSNNDEITYTAGDILLAIGENAMGGLPERNGPWQITTVAAGLGTLVRPAWWPNGATLQTSQIPIEIGSEGLLFCNARFRAMGQQTAGLVLSPTNTFVVGIDDPGMYQEILTERNFLYRGELEIYAPTLSPNTSYSVLDVGDVPRPATTAYYSATIIPGDWGIEGGATIFANTAAGDIDTDNESEVVVGIMNQQRGIID
jgi:hypothetical protein